MTGMRGRLTKGAGWVILSRALVNLISLLSTFILARILTPDDFGLVALATTLLMIINALTDLSLANALIQHDDPTEDHFHTAWTLNLARSALIGGLVAIAAWPLAYVYDDSRLQGITLVLALSVFLTGFTNPKMTVFLRDLLFAQDFMLNVSQKIVGFAVSVAIALIYQSYWALVLGTVASQLAMIVVSYLLIPYRPYFRITHYRELFSFSLWLTFGQILNTINWRLDYFLIGGVAGRTALGYYSVGDNLASIPTREASEPVTKVLFSGLSLIKNDPEHMRATYSAAQALLTSVVLPVGFGFALCAKSVVLLAMGAKWLPIVPVIQGLAAILALQTLGKLVQPLAMAKGVPDLLFRRDLLSFFIRIPLVVAGLLLGGLHGVIIARMATGLIAIGFNLHLVRRLIGVSIKRQILQNVRSLLSIAVMVAGVFPLHAATEHLGTGSLMLLLQLAIIMSAGASLYICSHLLLWLAAGRPQGPETTILHTLGSAIQSLRERRGERAA